MPFLHDKKVCYVRMNMRGFGGLPMELALLPFVESGFEPGALSTAQAAGLWQFIPGTAQDVRAYFMTMQYWLGGSDENMLNLVRHVVDRVGMDGFNRVWTSPQTLPSRLSASEK